MGMVKDKITKLNDERNIYVIKFEESWNELLSEYEDTISDNKMDELGDQILDLIISNKEILEVDFIIEQLTKLGHSPSILYDDDGHFAVISDGYQSVVSDGPKDCELQFWVEKEYWFNTIREALYNYLEVN
jgi:hypothetical protein